MAFLSACEMAVNKDLLLKEEGLHVSGAFQMAGVPNTIATWWRVVDKVSVRVSGDFFKGLKRDGIVDVGRCAMSLREVTLRMRDEGLSAYLWGAYIHFGV